MKLVNLMFVSIFTLTLGLVNSSIAAESGKIKLLISGIASETGTIQIALADSEESHPVDAKPFKVGEAKIVVNRAIWIFDDIPYGDYSVRLYHDENDNRELDKGLFGVPKEAYGYSNNARESLSEPSWKDAMFTRNSNEIILKITVK